MKKRYQRPDILELPISGAVLQTGSNPYIKEKDSESAGGIDPDTQVSTGLGRRGAFDDEEYDDDY